MDKQTAYQLGFDCGYNGATKINCHFKIFAEPQFTKEWERGKKIGEAKIIQENEASLSLCCKKPINTQFLDDDVIFYCSKCNKVHSVTNTGFKMPKKKEFYKPQK